jgi:hypothetical protein
MRTNRRWFRISLILLVSPLIFAVYAGADRDGDRKETTYRWDIIKIPNSNPPTVFEGGFASALANDGSSITVTGHGTFEPREPDEVTGGGAWTTYAPGSTTVTGNGTYRVQQLVRFDLAPGVLTGTVDNIPGAKGDLTDTRAGLILPPGFIGGDVTADGRRFLIGVPVTQSASVPFTVVLNWRTILKK